MTTRTKSIQLPRLSWWPTSKFSNIPLNTYDGNNWKQTYVCLCFSIWVVISITAFGRQLFESLFQILRHFSLLILSAFRNSALCCSAFCCFSLLYVPHLRAVEGRRHEVFSDVWRRQWGFLRVSRRVFRDVSRGFRDISKCFRRIQVCFKVILGNLRELQWILIGVSGLFKGVWLGLGTS